MTGPEAPGAPAAAAAPPAGFRSSLGYRFAPEILFFAVTAAAGVWAAGRWVDPTGDPGVWWSLAGRMARGERLYRDVYLQYGPLSPYLFLLTGKPFAFSRSWFLLANWIPALGAGLLLLRLTRQFLTAAERIALAGFLLSVSIFAARPARLVLPYSPAAIQAVCFALGAILVLQSRRPGRAWRGYAAGALAGLALCAKQEIGVAAFLAICAPIATDRRRAAGWTLRCLAGFAAVATLGALLILGTGASVESLRLDSHLWPLASVPAGWGGLFRRVAGLSTVDRVHSLASALWQMAKLTLAISIVAMLLAREKRRWLVGAGAALLALFLALDLARGQDLLPRTLPMAWSMTVAFSIAVLAWLDRRRKGRDVLIALGGFAGLVALRTAFSWDPSGPYSGITHLATTATWAIFILCFVSGWVPAGPDSRRRARTLWLALLLPVAWAGAARAVYALREPGRVPVTTPRGTIYCAARAAAQYEGIGRETRPGERALLLPETHALDVLYGMRDVSPLLGHLPGWLDERAERRLLVRLQTNPPDVVVLFERPTREFGVEAFGRGYAEALAGWIDRSYVRKVGLPGAVILRPREKPLSSSEIH
ncbi:MAG: hypothetical protein LC796_11160 [Acidobacteria bacterium]|nr:hypothetical protein [Acidobacteriota bacterium]MCA1610329.1 hypothetical protein [Acidobacteriota bacterium]